MASPEVSTAFLNITDSLKSRGVKDVELNLSIVRGIDYYTDMVFEAYDKENRRLGALCGGGRYDSLPSIYGRPDLGATGVAGGVERAILAYKFSKKETARVFVAPVGDNPKIVAIASSVAAGLRSEGIPAQSEITGRSLRRILEIQSYLGTRAVVIVGEREIAQKVVKVKWMKTGEENTVALSELKRALS
ncbi:MAG: ATP phosphoribosyltransferase regulatory subunit [Nitrososphaerota archaeon]|nr:ATP phosphoribosyltransferase regulatory subunit [Nitrososphaerota archaeon]